MITYDVWRWWFFDYHDAKLTNVLTLGLRWHIHGILLKTDVDWEPSAQRRTVVEDEKIFVSKEKDVQMFCARSTLRYAALRAHQRGRTSDTCFIVYFWPILWQFIACRIIWAKRFLFSQTTTKVFAYCFCVFYFSYVARTTVRDKWCIWDRLRRAVLRVNNLVFANKPRL